MRLLKSPDILARLRDFQVSVVPDHVLASVRDRLPDPLMVREVSSAAASLCTWMEAVCNWGPKVTAALQTRVGESYGHAFLRRDALAQIVRHPRFAPALLAQTSVAAAQVCAYIIAVYKVMRCCQFREHPFHEPWDKSKGKKGKGKKGKGKKGKGQRGGKGIKGKKGKMVPFKDFKRTLADVPDAPHMERAWLFAPQYNHAEQAMPSETILCLSNKSPSQPSTIHITLP